MQQIVIKSTKGNAVTTSLLVAEKFGKRHVEVIDAIRNLMKVENSTFVEDQQVVKLDTMFYSTTQKIKMPVGDGFKDSPIVVMNRDGFSLLVMGFTGAAALKFKLEFIAAFNEMERQLSSPVLPATYLDALKALVSSEEQKQIAENKILELEPKADVYDMIVESDGLTSLNDAAKLLYIGRNTMLKNLRAMKVLDSSNIAYQRFIDSGYFVIKSTPVVELNTIYHSTMVTGKGLTWLAKKLK